MDDENNLKFLRIVIEIFEIYTNVRIMLLKNIYFPRFINFFISSPYLFSMSLNSFILFASNISNLSFISGYVFSNNFFALS